MAKPGFNPKELLQNLGWKDGKGLGRTESGITEAIKPKLKMDTAGVGHDQGAQFTNHWWDHVFNSAASNIQVDMKDEKIKVKKVGNFQISTKGAQTLATNPKNKSLMYGSFVKSATLENGVLEKETSSSDDSSDSDDEEKARLLTAAFGGMTDEQLFKACGGRTAHKGARHGHRMNGKLARIAAAEAMHSNSSSVNNSQQVSSESNDSSEEEKESANSKILKSKVKIKKSAKNYCAVTTDSETVVNIVKKKKSKKNVDNSDTLSTEKKFVADDEKEVTGKEIAKKRMKKKSKETLDVAIVNEDDTCDSAKDVQILDNTAKNAKKKKKIKETTDEKEKGKNKNKRKCDVELESTTKDNDILEMVSPRKKTKKEKKMKSKESDMIDLSSNLTHIGGSDTAKDLSVSRKSTNKKHNADSTKDSSINATQNVTKKKKKKSKTKGN